jgi:excisionase family DNA binding protein
MKDPTAGTTQLRPLLVTPVQAAAILNVGRTTIYYLARDGFLTPIRIGRATRYAFDDLEAYVRTRGRTTADEPEHATEQG